MNEIDVLNFLTEREDKTKINWQQYFEKETENATICAVALAKFFHIKQYRNKEKKTCSRRIPNNELRQQIEGKFKVIREQMIKDGNGLFYPGGLLSDGTFNYHFSYTDVEYWLKIILHPDFFLPDDMETDFEKSINCALTLRVVFHAFMNNPLNQYPVKVIFVLYERMTDLTEKMEKSLVIIKPDGVGKKIIGSIISRFEDNELYIGNIKMIHIDRALACKHYHEHEGKPFFERLINYITADCSVAMIVEGEDAIKKVRDIMGSTDPLKAEAGTIRGDFGTDITLNVVHGSDSPKSAEREINLFFGNGVL